MRWEGHCLALIDQTRLPHEESWVECHTAEAVADAIARMVVRGAPAIGIAAAFGLALAAQKVCDETRENAWRSITQAARGLRQARPTAVNLSWAVDRLLKRLAAIPGEGAQLASGALSEAKAVYEHDARINRLIGHFGLEVIPDGSQVLTHCNAGALATADYGTALGILRAAREAGRRLHVWVDETRPYWQGARLTAWELVNMGIDATLICDNMAGHFMKLGRIDRVIVGADRIALNGDTANKIGTYTLGVLAAAHEIPLFVAAPLSTIDPTCAHGDSIPIEERPTEELTHVHGKRVAANGIAVANPGFDVTPARYITGIVTEIGVLSPPFEPAITSALKAQHTLA